MLGGRGRKCCLVRTVSSVDDKGEQFPQKRNCAQTHKSSLLGAGSGLQFKTDDIPISLYEFRSSGLNELHPRVPTE